VSEASAALELCLHGLCGCCSGGDRPPCEPCLQLHLEHQAAVARFLEDVDSIQARHEQLRGAHPSWDQDVALPQHLANAAQSTPGEQMLAELRHERRVLYDADYHREIPIGKRWVIERYPELETLAWARGANLAWWREHRAQLEQLHPHVPALAWAQILDDPEIHRRAS
jgi:hypothetical protein